MGDKQNYLIGGEASAEKSGHIGKRREILNIAADLPRCGKEKRKEVSFSTTSGCADESERVHTNSNIGRTELLQKTYNAR